MSFYLFLQYSRYRLWNVLRKRSAHCDCKWAQSRHVLECLPLQPEQVWEKAESRRSMLIAKLLLYEVYLHPVVVFRKYSGVVGLWGIESVVSEREERGAGTVELAVRVEEVTADNVWSGLPLLS